MASTIVTKKEKKERHFSFLLTMLPLKGMASSKRNGFYLKEWHPLKLMTSFKTNSLD